MVNIFRSSNSNLNRTKTEGALPDTTQGLFPPYVRAYYSEQYNGRECSVHFYQEPADNCWAVLYETAINSELQNLNSGSTYYTKFTEIWDSNRLVAVICGKDYVSPEEHVKSHRKREQRSQCQKYKLGEYHLNLLKKEGEKAVIKWFEEEMRVPRGFTKDYLKNQPNYKEKDIKTLVF